MDYGIQQVGYSIDVFRKTMHRDLETFEQYHLNDCMGTSSVHQVSPAVSLFNLVTKTHDALFY